MSISLIRQQPLPEPVGSDSLQIYGPIKGNSSRVAPSGPLPMSITVIPRSPIAETASDAAPAPRSSFGALERTIATELTHVMHSWVTDISPSELGLADLSDAPAPGHGHLP